MRLPIMVAAVMGKKAAVVPWYLEGGVAAANCVGAYQAIGASSLAASYTNLAHPGDYTLTADSGCQPSFDTADGWAGDGASKFLQTGITPESTWSALVRYSGGSSGPFTLFGELGTTAPARFAIQPNWSDNKIYFCNGGQRGGGTGLDAGVAAIAGRSGYKNGVVATAAISAWTGSGAKPMFIFVDNGTSQYFPGKIQAIAFYNITLTDAQVAAISARMAALPL